ncbi:MAG: hypothetical protein HOE11_04585 [Candidatus Diapherotrites archaeon]|jgi:hypothetical protein|nr:hypothetical protein [Candidatus Diapherotrites archaeon]MBT4596814.1 hypothetical protein [Candidatus Diapherotrites archaeon]
MGAIKTLFVILIILIIAFFGLLTFAAYIDGDLVFDNYSNDAKTTNNTSSSKPGFEDNAYFSISYPRSLNIERDTSVVSNSLASLDLYPSTNEFGISVWYSPSDGDTSSEVLDDLLEMHEASPYRTVISHKAINIDGLEGYELLLEGDDETGEYLSIDAFAIKGNKMINYNAIIVSDDYSVVKAQVDKIISSIKIK